MEDAATLYKNVRSKVPVSAVDFERLTPYFEKVIIKKRSQLVKEGEYNSRLFFVTKGLLYLYKTTPSDDIRVVQFAKEDYWLSDLCSFFTGSRSLFSIRTIDDCELYTLSKKHFDEICKNYPGMETFFRLQFQSAYANTLIRLADIYSQDAETKYDLMRQETPDLLQRVPQYLVASYLGVLPSSLSRIRGKK